MVWINLVLELLLANCLSSVHANICSYHQQYGGDNRTLDSSSFTSLTLMTRHATKVQQSASVSRNFSSIVVQKQTNANQVYRMVMLESFQIKSKKTCKNKLARPTWDNQEMKESVVGEREWTKNYASAECGAKLVRASGGMKNPSHLISRNADEYMLYNCREPSYFIIELCETMRVVRFELDNKELYSGTPWSFTVRTGPKFSPDLNDWNHVGDFEASSQKMETQNFSGFKVKTFGKFIRVEINSFHGSEHFCTLTSFRVFGQTEYDYLAMNDDDLHNDPEQSEGYLTIAEETSSRSQSYSSRMIRVDMSQDDEMTTYTYEYLFLQTRKDVCFDNLLFPRGDNSEVDGHNLISSENTRGMKKEKDSVLVGLSNKVKILEKNLTAQNIVVKNLENFQTQQNKDLNKMHKTTQKTDETLKAFTKDSEDVKSDVAKQDDKIRNLEKEMFKFEDSLFIATGICVFLAIICNFLVLYICCWLSFDKRNSTVEKPPDSVEATTEPTTEPKSKSVKDSEVQTDAVPTAPATVGKKVSFSDDNNNADTRTLKDQDISMRLNVRRIVRRDPSRRVTWCAGTLKKLAIEAQQLIREI